MKIYADSVDITPLVGNLSWQNTIAELATSMSFEIGKLDSKHTLAYIPNVGSIISMVTDIEVFRGIVLTVDDGSKISNSYTVCDFGFYLNKSSETYQFNDMSADQLITKICYDFDIGIDNICSIPNKITQIYFDKSISDIIWDVLDQSGGGFNFDMTPKGLRIYRIGDLRAYPIFRLSPNTPDIYSPNMKGNVFHSLSIEDMKNKIKVITAGENEFDIKVIAENQELINKYGLLQEVVKIDEEKENPYMVADSKLSELARVKENFSFEIIEDMDSYTRAGAIIEVDGVSYLIEGSTHTVQNNIHYVNLDLRRW